MNNIFYVMCSFYEINHKQSVLLFLDYVTYMKKPVYLFNLLIENCINYNKIHKARSGPKSIE